MFLMLIMLMSGLFSLDISAVTASAYALASFTFTIIINCSDLTTAATKKLVLLQDIEKN